MKSRLVRLTPFLAVAALVLVLVLLSKNTLVAKKIIALFLMPSGLIWMALFAGIFWPGVSKKLRAVFAMLWIAFGLAGSPYVGNGLLRALEAPFYEVEEVSERLDAIVVLGGGTRQSPGGKPVVGSIGDRLIRPLILYQEGKVKTLITTGRSITEIGNDRILSRETSEIWQSLGIPAAAIIERDKPRTTAEELIEVAALLKEHPEWKRVGICSSASHLRRALNEAEKQGLTLIPVPSDFRSTPLAFVSIYLIPQGRGFKAVQSACWEFLGLMI